MERRNFFKFIGIPFLFLPFINLFSSSLKKTKIMSLYVNGVKIAEAEGFPIVDIGFNEKEMPCSDCGKPMNGYIISKETKFDPISIKFLSKFNCRHCHKDFDVVFKFPKFS